MTGVGLTEADVQRGLIEAAQTGGWLVYHTHDSRRSRKGFPDLVLVRPPKHLASPVSRRHKYRGQ